MSPADYQHGGQGCFLWLQHVRHFRPALPLSQLFSDLSAVNWQEGQRPRNRQRFRARQDSNTHSYNNESFQARFVGYCFAHRSWCSFAGGTRVDHCCQSFKHQNHSCVTISIQTFCILFLKYKPYPTMV
jgi:hypothetical protein